MDRRAACMTYQGKAYRDDSALQYFERSREKDLMHPETSRQLRFVLRMLAEQGEKETFSYLRRSVLKGKPFPWEEAQDSLMRKYKRQHRTIRQEVSARIFADENDSLTAADDLFRGSLKQQLPYQHAYQPRYRPPNNLPPCAGRRFQVANQYFYRSFSCFREAWQTECASFLQLPAAP